MRLNNRNLFVRADATTETGMGHIMRCIALAQAWQDYGGNVTFMSHCESHYLQQRIRDEGFEFVFLERTHPHPSDLKNVLKQLETRNSKLASWLVLDGYNFTPDYHKSIKEKGHSLMVIDDMAHLDHYHTDILLNQNIYASSLQYSCDRETFMLLGCENVLLRREFFTYKNTSRNNPQKAKNVVVTMGGADPCNVTLKIIEALKLLHYLDLDVKIIAGPKNPHIDILKDALNKQPSYQSISNRQHRVSSGCLLQIVQDVTNIPKIMVWADMAVSAGGSTCWETAFMGLPTLIIILSENQREIAQGLEAAGVGVNLGWHENLSISQISKAIEEKALNVKKRSSCSEKGQNLINYKGRKRVIRAMLCGQIKLRNAQKKDCELLWKWVNDPRVRHSSFNTNRITWEEHQAWFSNKQIDLNCTHYIAFSRYDVPIGQIRFELKDAVAEIDYSIDKDFRGMELGKILIKEGIEQFCAEKKISLTMQGAVKKENDPSNQAFKALGFIEVDEKPIHENNSTNKCIIYQLRHRSTM
jgi:UDP-2,4-diacetamido-2,4,6-trideoxy-beta-L-altropyranose hydrolase